MHLHLPAAVATHLRVVEDVELGPARALGVALVEHRRVQPFSEDTGPRTARRRTAADGGGRGGWGGGWWVVSDEHTVASAEGDSSMC